MSQAQLNILYVSHSANLYGAERSLLQLLTDLDREEFSPIVVLPQRGPLQKQIEDSGIPVQIIPSLKAWSTRHPGLRGFIRLVATLPFILISVLSMRRIARRYKIQLIHSNTAAIIDGALAAKSLGVPHVWHIREILNEDAPHNFGIRMRTVVGIVLALSDQVIAISQAVAHAFVGMKGAEKVRVIYNPVNTRTFAQYDPRVRVKYRRILGVSDDMSLVGQIAHVVAAKGYTDFIRAIPLVLKKIPSTRFIGVGGIPHADYKADIVRLVEELNIGDSFILTGFRKDVPQIMAALDVVVLASRYEPLGRAVIEGMAAGKPVVGTNAGGIPEIIEDGVTGLIVPPGCPEKLAEAILRILEDSKLADMMGEAGRLRVQRIFDPGRYAKEIETIYQDLMASTAYNSQAR